MRKNWDRTLRRQGCGRSPLASTREETMEQLRRCARIALALLPYGPQHLLAQTRLLNGSRLAICESASSPRPQRVFGVAKKVG
jgi:hypothetical protein